MNGKYGDLVERLKHSCEQFHSLIWELDGKQVHPVQYIRTVGWGLTYPLVSVVRLRLHTSCYIAFFFEGFDAKGRVQMTI